MTLEWTRETPYDVAALEDGRRVYVWRYSAQRTGRPVGSSAFHGGFEPGGEHKVEALTRDEAKRKMEDYVAMTTPRRRST